MTAELYAIFGVGIAVLGLNWRMYATLRQDVRVLAGRLDVLQVEVAGVKERLAGLESTVNLIVQGLHIEVRGR